MVVKICPRVLHLRPSCFLIPQNLACNGSLLQTRDVTVTAKRYASQSPFNKDEDRRIYILGTSPVAMLTAHGLASSPDPPPLTLLATNFKILEYFKEQNWAVEVIRDGISDKVHGFEMEPLLYESRSALLFPKGKVLQIQPAGLLANYDRIEDEKKYAEPKKSAPEITPEPKEEPNETSAPNGTQWPGMYLSKVMAPVRKEFRLVRKPSRKLQGPAREIEGLGADPKPELPLIKYLFITSHPQYLERTMLDLKPRLRKESTIVFTAKGQGFLEKLDEVVWPDISTRPSYIIGTSTHVAWVPGPDGKPAKKSLDDALNFRNFVSTERHFVAAVKSTENSALYLGPIEQECYMDNVREIVEDLEKRNLNAEYFLNHLYLAKGLNVQQLDQRRNLWKRLVKFAVQSVVAPLCTIYQLPLHSLFNGPGSERRKHEAMVLMEQEHKVLRKYQPRITLEIIERAVEEACKVKDIDEDTGKPLDNYSNMLLDVLQGRISELEFLNGWIVQKGKNLGIDVSMHENAISHIRAKTEERISLKIKMEQAKTLAQREDMMKERQEAWEAKREMWAEEKWYGMTKAEKRDQKKLEGIRGRMETLSLDPSPKIQPLGNETIIKYVSADARWEASPSWNPLNGPRPTPTLQSSNTTSQPLETTSEPNRGLPVLDAERKMTGSL